MFYHTSEMISEASQMYCIYAITMFHCFIVPLGYGQAFFLIVTALKVSHLLGKYKCSTNRLKNLL